MLIVFSLIWTSFALTLEAADKYMLEESTTPKRCDQFATTGQPVPDSATLPVSPMTMLIL